MEGGGGDPWSTLTMASLPHTTTKDSSTLRFIGILNLPDPDNSHHNSHELDESDVVWSSLDDFSVSPLSSSPSPSTTVSNSPTNNPLRVHHHSSGLSAALYHDDHRPLVRRQHTLSPSFSAASAARMIPPVAQVRSEVKFYQSAPVNVPIWSKRDLSGGILGNLDEVDDDLDDDGGVEMVPPHEIVARSHVTFSVFEGVGRTLKGRDLRRVRNAVFQKTGFLD